MRVVRGRGGPRIVAGRERRCLDRQNHTRGTLQRGDGRIWRPPRERVHVRRIVDGVVRAAVVPPRELLVRFAPRATRPQPHAEGRVLRSGGLRLGTGRCGAPIERDQHVPPARTDLGIDVAQLRDRGDLFRAREARGGDRRAEPHRALEVVEPVARTARDARFSSPCEQRREPNLIGMVPARAEWTAELFDGFVVIDRIAVAVEVAIERGGREPGLDVARLGEDPDLEVSPRIDGAAPRDECRDIDRIGCAHAAAGKPQGTPDADAHAADELDELHRCILTQNAASEHRPTVDPIALRGERSGKLAWLRVRAELLAQPLCDRFGGDIRGLRARIGPQRERWNSPGQLR